MLKCNKFKIVHIVVTPCKNCMYQNCQLGLSKKTVLLKMLHFAKLNESKTDTLHFLSQHLETCNSLGFFLVKRQAEMINI